MPSNLNVLNVILVLAVILFLGGCEQAPEPSTKGQSEASSYTIASNKRMAERLDFNDQQDFKDAQRGLVARAPNNELLNQQGNIMWNPGSYDFVSGEAPETVNPSLWRQAKLNNIRGLFKVEEGIYQLRGFDLANITLIKSDNGWICGGSSYNL